MKSIRALVCVSAVVVSAYIGYSYWEAQWYSGMIPTSLELSGVVSIGDQGIFREGCGAAVFRLSEDNRENVGAKGLAAFVAAKKARSHDDPYHTYSEWRQTPHIPTGDGLTLADRWLLGLGCAGLSRDLRGAIANALRTGGSFYSTTEEAGLIVIPSLGIAVFSHYG